MLESRRLYQLFVTSAFCMLFSIGCMTTSPVSESKVTKRTKLIRTQAGDQVTLQWDTELGVTYSVIYSKTLKKVPKWKRLPNYSDIPGNGNTTTIRFTAPEAGRIYYRLSEQKHP